MSKKQAYTVSARAVCLQVDRQLRQPIIFFAPNPINSRDGQRHLVFFFQSLISQCVQFIDCYMSQIRISTDVIGFRLTWPTQALNLIYICNARHGTLCSLCDTSPKYYGTYKIQVRNNKWQYKPEVNSGLLSQCPLSHLCHIFFLKCICSSDFMRKS